MLQNTNQNAVANGISQCVSKGEFLKFLGLRLAMACVPRRGPISVYWETGSEAGTVQTLVVASKCPGTDFKIYRKSSALLHHIMVCTLVM